MSYQIKLAKRGATAASVVGSVALWHHHYGHTLNTIENESQDPKLTDPAQPFIRSKYSKSVVPPADKFSTWVWGSNRHATLLPPSAGVSTVKSPRVTTYIPPSTPLRDLALQDEYGAAVDINGDIWMWGQGYYGNEQVGEASGQPVQSLRGKNIASLAPTKTKLYALSAKSGQIYGIPADRAHQLDRHVSADAESWPWWTLGLGRWLSTDPGVDYVRLQPADGLESGEKFVSVVAGQSHILALTNKGKAYSMATDADGNSHSQLGTRHALPAATDQTHPVNDIRWNTTLNPITSLRPVNVAQIAAGLKSSYFRLDNGRVLGLGANMFGQLGLGSNVTLDKIPAPSEIVLSRFYPGREEIRCSNVAAGGNNAYFTVERTTPYDPQAKVVDVLAVGSGIAGGLGTGAWSNAMSTPSKVKSVSGIQEYSDAQGRMVALEPSNISVSPSPYNHVFITLNTAATSTGDASMFGDDAVVFGANQDYQLGNGKKTHLPAPQPVTPVEKPAQAVRVDGADVDASITQGVKKVASGPQSRLQVYRNTVDAHDLAGNMVKKNVKVQQVLYAGHNASAMYWRVV